MDENKQIEEIAKDLCPLYEKYKSCKTCDAVLGVGEEPCVYKCMAELITTKGYRKQSEGEWIKHPCSYECTLCGEEFYVESYAEDYDPITDYGLYYCPNCGAKMKGE